jgi:succinate dehydrogenase/fumarate reductase flavoprotein subunit
MNIHEKNSIEVTRRRFLTATSAGAASLAVAGCDPLEDFLGGGTTYPVLNAGATYDVIVVGSGAAGLTAALAARANGAKVLLLEATPKVGGTTVFSGGQVWVPNHHHMHEVGGTDSREDALDYLRATSPNRGGALDEERWAAFVDNGPTMIRFVEERTPLRFMANTYPDSHAELKGGKTLGRHLEAVPFAPGGIAGHREDLRHPPEINGTNLPVTWQETYDVLLNFTARKMMGLAPYILYRYVTGQLTIARALVAGLYTGCVQGGVEVVLGARVRELLIANREVQGVRVDYSEPNIDLRARGGVILATGGFEWNPELVRRYLPGRINYPASNPASRGDGLLMALQAGAMLAHMDESMYWPGIRNPKYFYEGAPLANIVTTLCLFPHSVIVNRAGRRFENEASEDFSYAMQARDSSTGELLNLPCWAIFDSQFLQYGAPELGILPNRDVPSWVSRFDSLGQLATHVGIDGIALAQTVKRFNASAREGEDPEFRKGETLSERLYGAGGAPHPNLGPVERPPFYAIELFTTTLGTTGGPMTTGQWEVLHEDGTPIQGLYAVGITSALITYHISAGGTLGPGMTAGYLAGNAAAVRASGAA